MRVDKYDNEIIYLIPQKPPFVMVGEVVHSDEVKTETEFLIEDDNLFVEEGFFREPGLIENMAQTLAVRGGLIRSQERKEVSVGLIGAIKNLNIYGLPPVNTRIRTRITIVKEIMNATMISGKVFQEGKILAECEMKIFLRKENES